MLSDHAAVTGGEWGDSWVHNDIVPQQAKAPESKLIAETLIQKVLDWTRRRQMHMVKYKWSMNAYY